MVAVNVTGEPAVIEVGVQVKLLVRVSGLIVTVADPDATLALESVTLALIV